MPRAERSWLSQPLLAGSMPTVSLASVGAVSTTWLVEQVNEVCLDA